ncbi:MAG: hypothetical protein KF858_03885 [Candidatus Sumerlaeia bacterium]|nr:hypothetical protein [Candidatus Sumerlaeia bacterium]
MVLFPAGLHRLFARLLAGVVAILAVDMASASPWDTPVPEHRGTIVILPPQNGEGVFSPDAMKTTHQVFNALHAFSPSGLYSASHQGVYTQLSRMSPQHPDGIVAVEEHVATLARYYGGQFVLHSTFRSIDGRDTMECTLVGPSFTESRQFEVEEGNNLELAHEILMWMLDTMNLKLTPEERARLEYPLRGLRFRSSVEWRPYFDATSRETIVESLRSGTDWLTSAEPGRTAEIYFAYAKFLFENNVLHEDAGDTFRVPDEVIANEGLPSLDFARGLYHLWKGELEEARLALWTYLARQPTDEWALHLLVHRAYPRGSRLDDFLSNLGQWHARAPSCAWSDAQFGLHLHRSAWDYHNSRYGTDTYLEGVRQFHSVMRLSTTHLERAEAAVGPIPAIAVTLIDNHGSTNNVESMYAVYRRSFPAYPFSREILSTTLHFTRPRWHGTLEQAMELMDERFQSGTMMGEVAAVPLSFHWEEGRTLYARERDTELAFYRYLSDLPHARRQIVRAAEIQLAEGTRKACARAAVAGILLVDRQLVHRALATNPALLDETDAASAPLDSEQVAIEAIRCVAELEQWEAVEKMAAHIQSNPDWNSRSRTGSPAAHARMMSVATMQSVAYAMLNGRQAPGRLPVHMQIRAGGTAWSRAYGAFVHVLLSDGGTAGGAITELLDPIAQQAEYDLEVQRIVAATRALIAWRAGDQEEARKQLALMQPDEPMFADWVRGETCQRILGEVPANVWRRPQASGD